MPCCMTNYRMWTKTSPVYTQRMSRFLMSLPTHIIGHFSQPITWLGSEEMEHGEIKHQIPWNLQEQDGKSNFVKSEYPVCHCWFLSLSFFLSFFPFWFLRLPTGCTHGPVLTIYMSTAPRNNFIPCDALQVKIPGYLKFWQILSVRQLGHLIEKFSLID